MDIDVERMVREAHEWFLQYYPDADDQAARRLVATILGEPTELDELGAEQGDDLTSGDPGTSLPHTGT